MILDSLFQYHKLDYLKYQECLNDLLKEEDLQKLGIQKTVIGKTIYHYDLDCITVGNGEKELFLVGGTHGSEWIGVDFLLHFLKALPTLENFDPNEFKLVVIPLQNPEGFDISTNTAKGIVENTFQDSSFEYYLRYRTDSIIVNAISALNQLIYDIKQQKNMITATQVLLLFQNFIQTNPKWSRLSERTAIPEIGIFNQLVIQLNPVDSFQDLQNGLLQICNQAMEKITEHTLSSHFAKFFIEELKNGFAKNGLWDDIEKSCFPKLYQEMFERSNFEGVINKKMEMDVSHMYQKYQHPKGSQIGHDANGIGINLNANNFLNPGLHAQDNIIYGPGVKSNIKNYFPGPLGVPTLEKEHFSYVMENQVLENLIATSYQEGKYLGCLLYHGTGGLIYYKPFQDLMNEPAYQQFYQYNQKLAYLYHEKTNYQLLDSSDTTGYGDYLRRNYPGVLLIELSKMGGNPIGPYGDPNNIYQVFQDNTRALDSIFLHFHKIKTKKRI